MVKLSLYVKHSDVSLVLNTWETFYLTAVVAKVDKYAEIEYSMVSSPTVSNSFIGLNLKVKNCTFHRSEASVCFIKKQTATVVSCSASASSFRANFTTSESIRSLRSPPQPSPCRPRSTTCCTSACRPSPPTPRRSSTLKLEPSACTSLMTW